MHNQNAIESAGAAIRDGQLVAFPTETVYGLGANALDAIAVAKIFELKGRPRFDPLIVHVADAETINDLVDDVPPLAKRLIDKFWPGPLSIVLKKRLIVPDIVTAGLPSVALRCPAHPIARQLIQAAGVPVAAPSANKFGRVSPTTADHVRQQFVAQISVIDGGPCEVGVESTVVSFVDTEAGKPKLLRPGGVTREQIESLIGPVDVGLNENARPTSPGQLTQHYSPSTPLILAVDPTSSLQASDESRIGLLCLRPTESPNGFAAVEVLSQDGCYREAAANLFAAMRRLDELGLDLIIAQPVPEIELGHAIMDRLRRAAAP